MHRPRSVAVALALLATACAAPPDPPAAARDLGPYASARPWTRWWWFAEPIAQEDITRQLDWLQQNGFGGVELAFVYPRGGKPVAGTPAWLSPAFGELLRFAKAQATARGLGCDFTFGTLWPFGDSQVPDEEGAVVYGKDGSEAGMRLTWEHPTRGRVIDHLDHVALQHYAERLAPVFAPALALAPSSLFCDSWEVETRWIWRRDFAERFQARYGYDLRPLVPTLLEPAQAGVLYDYFRLVSDLVLDEFYAPFTALCHGLGAWSRVQCGGAPVDLLSAFARVDVPETEAVLYEPGYARIPASAAALAGRPLVAAETFTCLYGWKGWPGPGPHQGEEQVADLKLVCDALFAHGTNQIVWHGMPFQAAGSPARFFASVHVGPDSGFAADLPAFNRYMTRIAEAMRRGRPYSDVAVYLPVEDGFRAGAYPKELQMPWVWGQYEMRYVRPPRCLDGRQPLWVNGEFLAKGRCRDGRLHIGDMAFGSLLVDVDSLDRAALASIVALAEQGLPICLTRVPRDPGHVPHPDHAALLARLLVRPNVVTDFAAVHAAPPLLAGDDLPDHWCRDLGDELLLFVADPDAKGLRYPLAYGQARRTTDLARDVTLNAFGRRVPLHLVFAPGQSLLLHVGRDGSVREEDLGYLPPRPRQS